MIRTPPLETILFYLILLNNVSPFVRYVADISLYAIYKNKNSLKKASFGASHFENNTLDNNVKSTSIKNKKMKI